MNFPNAPGPADSSGRARLPSKLSPMLATPGVPPRGDAGWAYEMKWDGVRALAFIEDGQLRLASRTGRDITVAYPELTALGPAAARSRCWTGRSSRSTTGGRVSPSCSSACT